MPKVTGIGGVFFKSSDPVALRKWYATHLGIELESWGGAALRWADDPLAAKGATVWHTAAEDTQWFSPSEASFMINYRVDDLDGLLQELRDAGVTIVAGPEIHDNGKFGWVMDCDGNKVELWEPSA